MKKFISLTLLLIAGIFYSENFRAQLTLDSCYSLSEKHYPLVNRRQIIEQKSDLETQVLKKNLLPQIGLNAQATYQSDVTAVNIPSPNFDVPSPNKDQYKSYININQVLYDGGAIKNALNVQRTGTALQQQQITVTLYQIKEQVNNLFFAVLLLQENEKQLEELQKNLEQKRKELQSAVTNGLALQTNLDLLDIELLKIEQQISRLEQDKTTSIASLEQLTGSIINPDQQFEIPEITNDLLNELNRPELELFTLQKNQIDANTSMQNVRKKPVIAAFTQAGIGNPALNMLDNTFQGYYIAGIKLNWTIYDWNKTNTEKDLLQLQKKMVDNEQEIFTFHTQLEQKRLNQEIEKHQEAIETDQKIIALRKKVVTNYDSQLKNQSITYSEYLTELTALNQAELLLKTHEIQLIQTKTLLNLVNGN